MSLEKGPTRKNPDQKDLFSGESLAKYCDPKSPEFLDRLTDVVISRIEYAKKNAGTQAPLFVVQELLSELRLQDKFNPSEVTSSVMDKIRERENAVGQAEMRELNSNKIRAEADKRWTEEGKKDEDIPYWTK